MFKSLTLVLAIVVTVYSAEISPSFAPLGNQAGIKPELNVDPNVHGVLIDAKPDVAHPVYRAEERYQARARIEPVRPLGPVIKHDALLADQAAGSTEVNRADKLGMIGDEPYLTNTAEVAYPDIPYAPGYLYDTGYGAPNGYDMYGMNQIRDFMEPDTSAFSLLWSQVPYGRTVVSYVGRTIMWIFNSIFVLLLGSLLTIGACSYTNLCTIAFNGVGPIHEEVRSLITPERLENISNAADFVKTAIDKYQKIQKVTDEVPMARRRRAIFNY